MKSENPSYYAIIPAAVRYDNTIPAGAKLLYGEVTALSNQKGYCFASNGYFAKLYACTPQAISKWFKLLEKAGHVAISYHENNGQKERRVSIAVDRHQPQLRGVSTTVEGVSTTVEHINTSILIQEDKRESAPENLNFFNPNKHEQTATHLISFLNQPKNKMWLNGMSGDWQRAVKGYCAKLQKLEKWNQLQVPEHPDAHYRWFGAMLAGIKSWYQTAAEFDKQSGRAPDAVTIKAVKAGKPEPKIKRASADEARKIAGL